MGKIVWKPNPDMAKQSHLAHFIQYVNQKNAVNFSDYTELYHWSITHLAEFWQAVSDFCGILYFKPPKKIINKALSFQDTEWFSGASLNFAENLLRRRDAHPALIFVSERGHYQSISYQQLFEKVCCLAAFLNDLGIKAGDRVVGVLANMPQAVIAMLATTSLGAIWSAVSPDFGVNATVERFAAIKPKIVFAVDGYFYKGQAYSQLEKIKALQRQLPTVTQTILIPYLEDHKTTTLPATLLWQECFKAEKKIYSFTATPFAHPLYILFSSGTTGKPKCIVHSVGGTLIQHLKELMLHTNLKKEHRIFFNTTCGWMMWNWVISSLAIGSTIILYEGAALYPTENRLFELIDALEINIFGIGAKYFETLAKLNFKIKKSTLNSLQTILTTASPLIPESFDYIYANIKSTVQVSSISGGSDIISCFALGNPLLPVRRGELQCLGLGMSVKVFDETANAIINEKGELVCTEPFPSMPLCFWGDFNKEKYFQAYFAKFPNVWTHGDYAKITPSNGLIIYGRSDTTLNPNGIRMGTAEIYNELDKMSEIMEALAVGQQQNGNERIILFILLRENVLLNDALCKKIKNSIRENISPHHVPAEIIAAPDFPRTQNGKLSEIAVKKIINHLPLDNIDAIANPESLDFFRELDLG